MGHVRNGRWWMIRPPDYPTAPQSRTGPVRDCLPLHTVPPTPPQRRCPGPPSAPPTTTKGRHRPHLSESSADRRVPRPSPLVLTPRPLRIGGFGLRNRPIRLSEHGSWLNMAEIKFSVLSRSCLNQRLPGEAALQRESKPGSPSATPPKPPLTGGSTPRTPEPTCSAFTLLISRLITD